jgi:hypothetical protein
MTNRRRPNGGVVIPICIQISMITPNQIWSNPSIAATGTKIGVVIIIIGTLSINVPRTIMIPIITSNKPYGGKLRVVRKPNYFLCYTSIGQQLTENL